MPEDITVRLPPNLIVKLDRRAARIGVTRSEHIAFILRASLEGGRPVILKADPTAPTSVMIEKFAASTGRL